MIMVDDYTVIDIETAGFSIDNDEIIEIGAVKVRKNKIIAELELLIRPSFKIPKNISKLTGITNEMVKNKPSIFEILEEFIDFIGDDVLVGHNIDNFDMRMLNRETDNYLGKEISNDTVDTLKIAKKLIPINNHTLNDVCYYYGFENTNAHRALSDVIATHECYQKMKNGDAPVNIDPAPKKEHSFKPQTQFNGETKALQTLQGILFGVTCDNILTEAEVFAVKKWLEDNEHLSGTYPFDVAYAEIKKVLEDGILETSELESLLRLFLNIIDPVATESTCSSEAEASGFNDKTVCLSGEFTHGSKSDIGSLLSSLGATVKDNVSKKLDILLVGDVGSDAWICVNYGGKIKKAMEINQKGGNIIIMSESDFYKTIEKNNRRL